MKDNLFSIGEVANAVGITRKTILGYEQKELIFPDKKEGKGGNRYYSIDTLTKVRTIRTLQNLWLSLDEIREYYNGTTDLPPMIERLERMRDELNLTIERLKERTSSQSINIKEITVEPQTVYIRVIESRTVSEKTVYLRNTALEAMKEYGTDTTRCMYFTEYSSHSPNNISYCIAVPSESEGKNIKRYPKLRGITLFHHGAYENIPETLKKLIRHAEENGIKLSGTFRNLFLEGPPQHKDKSRFITQIIAFIE